jgi:hypothetical protein
MVFRCARQNLAEADELAVGRWVGPVGQDQVEHGPRGLRRRYRCTGAPRWTGATRAVQPIRSAYGGVAMAAWGVRERIFAAV